MRKVEDSVSVKKIGSNGNKRIKSSNAKREKTDANE
jgi:hypothetical protein